MVWCDTCKYAVRGIPQNINVVVVDPSKPEELANCNRLDTVCIFKGSEVNTNMVDSLVASRRIEIEAIYKDISQYYRDVVFCTKRGTFMVRNPGVATQEVDMATVCPFYEPVKK